MIFNIPTRHWIVIFITAVVITILTLMTTGHIVLIFNTTIFIIYILWLEWLDGKIGWKGWKGWKKNIKYG